MNAVNLIPADARKRRSTVSASPITLALIGLLVAALGGAVLYVSTVNKVTARKAELASVNASVARWQAAASTFSQVEATAAARQAQLDQVHTLADQRYAWAKLLSQLGDLLPAKAALISLQATTASTTAATTASSSPTTTTAATPSAPLPSIQLSGCASSQPMVAKTMEQLHKITDVSDVSLSASSDSGASGGSGASGSGGCPFPITFQVSLTFSAPSAGATAAASGTTVAAPATASPAATPATTPASATSTGAAQ
jgi:Tfp pilus assembly protein PilN